MPKVIGCIDGTHIPIKRPPLNFYPDEYINRHGNHSINVQAVCVSRCIFLDIDCSWPGSVHDSRIFSNSNVYVKLTNNTLTGILLGDSGYKLSPFLLTPYLTPNTEAQHLFKNSHRATRVRIEMAFGQLKRRFSSLQNILRIKLQRCASFIYCCIILLNICKRWNDPDIISNQDLEIEGLEYPINDNSEQMKGQQIRNEIAQSPFLMRDIH